MGAIDDFLDEAKKTSPYVQFEEGEPVVCIFKSSKLVDDTYKKGEKTIEYSVEMDGITKTFKSKSQKLARLMKPIEEGDEIELVRTGDGFDTLWYVNNKTKEKKK